MKNYLLVLLALSGPLYAAEVKVKMLNSGEKGAIMVFEPAYSKVNVGDTVTFVPVQPGGHNARSLLVPEGAKGFVSVSDTAYSYKLEKEGVYMFACDPHKTMGMVGVIQAGKPVNLVAAKKLGSEEQAKFAMNKESYSNLLNQVK